MEMKLFVTVGNAEGDTQELIFDLPGPYRYIGLEIEDSSPDTDKTGRLTIMRQPFVVHGESTIHTICSRYDDSVNAIEM